MPILSGIYNRSIEIGCRPSSSQSTMTLFKVESKTGKHIELDYDMTNDTDLQAFQRASLKHKKIGYNLKRGFLLESIVDDRFICRAQLSEEGEDKSQDHSVIIQYTSKLADKRCICDLIHVTFRWHRTCN